MGGGSTSDFDPKLDLQLQRETDLPPEKVWAAWTQPELLKIWFCPKPWSVSDAVIDLRPGGRFATTFQSPEGQAHQNEGCYLEIEPGRKLVFTDALTAGYRPGKQPFMTAIVLIEPNGTGGTRYTAIAKHPDEATRQKHEEMGFATGWGAAWEQLVALMKGV